MMKLFILISLFAMAVQAVPIKFYVSLEGNDQNSGTQTEPFLTLIRAQEAVRQVKKTDTVFVYIREGKYHFPETLMFKPEDSGSAETPVIWSAVAGEKVVFSGSIILKLKWTRFRDGIIKAKISDKIDFDQLFVNGSRQIRARFPNYDYENPLRSGKGYQMVLDGSNKRYDTWFEFDPAIFTKKPWRNPTTGIVHAFQSHNWGNMQYRIKSVDRENRRVNLGEGGWQLQRNFGIGKGGNKSSPFFIENIFEELDVPGEWFFDEKEAMLYYFPPDSIDPNQALVEVVVVKDLIQFKGDSEKPVQFISFCGFEFTQTRTTFMEKYEPVSRSDWAIHRGGTLYLEGAENCQIENCNFEYIGGNGIFFSGYNRNNTVKGCRFYHTGESAVVFVGLTKAVRLYLTWDSWEIEGISWEEQRKNMDLKPGPKSPDYPSDCLVDNCKMVEIGDFGKQTAAVFISMSHRINIRYCTVYNTPRAGICIGDGTWGGHIIENCDIWETVRETGEHGPLNSWGRERMWLNGQGGSEGMIKELVLLDAIDPTIIRNNRIANYRKSISAGNWTIDLDDGSSNYHIYNNLSLGSTLKLREGFYRQVKNNIHVSSVPIGWHVWPDSSEDIFINNIVVVAGTRPGDEVPTDILFSPIRMPAHPWGSLVNRNVYWNVNTGRFLVQTRSPNVEYDWEKWRSFGYDAESVLGNPLFVDPAHGDYRVKAESPAIPLGFKNFPMDQFGHRQTRITPLGGSFKDSMMVTMAPDHRGGEIRYTLNGSMPTQESLLYTQPFLLTGTTTVRAQTIKNGLPQGFAETAVFEKAEQESNPNWLETLLSSFSKSDTGKAIRPSESEKLTWLGAHLSDINDPDLIDALGGQVKGVLVQEVPETSKAYQLGFKTSDVIVKFGDQSVETLKDFKYFIQKLNNGTVIQIVRGYGRIDISYVE